MLTKSNQPLLLGMLILLSLVPLFYNISTLPIRLFDESRLANNALEMNRDNNFLVVHYNGEPEMWSTKPPLMIYSQVVCMKVLGENELSVRIPAALCGLFTIILTFLFISKVTGQPAFGLTAALILIASPGYITEHGTRSGDYDSMLVFFLMLQLVSFYIFLLDTTRKKYWYLGCLGVLLAVFTKGIAGLMFLPGLFLYAIFIKKLNQILLSRETWIGILITMFLIFGYYGLREMYNPGYIHKVIENEITYRYFDVNEGHVGEWNFYLNYLYSAGYPGWYIFSIAGVIAGFLSKQSWFRKVVQYIALNTVLFLVVISNSQTKIEWYALPLFPIMGILSAAFFFYLYELIQTKLKGYFVYLKWFPVLLFTLLFVSNISTVMKHVLHPVELTQEETIYSLGYVFQKAIKGDINLDGKYYCYPPYNAHLQFYTAVLKSHGQNVTLIDKEKLQPGFQVLARSPDVQDYISEKYNATVLSTWNNNVHLLEIR